MYIMRSEPPVDQKLGSISDVYPKEVSARRMYGCKRCFNLNDADNAFLQGGVLLLEALHSSMFLMIKLGDEEED
jgi:hypothetical protein